MVSDPTFNMFGVLCLLCSCFFLFFWTFDFDCPHVICILKKKYIEEHFIIVSSMFDSSTNVNKPGTLSHVICFYTWHIPTFNNDSIITKFEMLLICFIFRYLFIFEQAILSCGCLLLHWFSIWMSKYIFCLI